MSAYSYSGSLFIGGYTPQAQADWDRLSWLRLLSGSADYQPASGQGPAAVSPAPAGRPAEIIGHAGYRLYR